MRWIIALLVLLTLSASAEALVVMRQIGSVGATGVACSVTNLNLGLCASTGSVL